MRWRGLNIFCYTSFVSRFTRIVSVTSRDDHRLPFMSLSSTTLVSTVCPLSLSSRITPRTWSLVNPMLAKSSMNRSTFTLTLWLTSCAGPAACVGLRIGGGGYPCAAAGGYPPYPPGGGGGAGG